MTLGRLSRESAHFQSTKIYDVFVFLCSFQQSLYHSGKNGKKKEKKQEQEEDLTLTSLPISSVTRTTGTDHTTRGIKADGILVANRKITTTFINI